MEAIVRSSKLLLPPVGEALLPPHPHPIVRAVNRPSSTGCSRRLNVRRRSSSLQFPDARLPGYPGEAAPGALLLVSSLSCRLSLGGAASCSYSRFVIAAFSRLALKGGRESLLFLAQPGEALLPPDPHPIVGPASGSSSTGCSRPLYVRRRHSSSVLVARPCRAATRASSSTSFLSCGLPLVGRRTASCPP